MKVELISHTPCPEQLVAAAARMCYSPKSYEKLLEELQPEKTDEMIAMLTSMGHDSPFEHITFTFELSGVSRSLLAQLTRHRIASYSVRSQRYVSEDAFTYVIPPVIAENPDLRAYYEKTMDTLKSAYSDLAEKLKDEHFKRLTAENMQADKAKKEAVKKAMEDARFVLPNAACTNLILTMNARALTNFFSLRCCMRAQWEIRDLAWEMLRLAEQAAPHIFNKAGPNCVRSSCKEGKFGCGKTAWIRNKRARLSERQAEEN